MSAKSSEKEKWSARYCRFVVQGFMVVLPRVYEEAVVNRVKTEGTFSSPRHVFEFLGLPPPSSFRPWVEDLFTGSVI